MEPKLILINIRYYKDLNINEAYPGWFCIPVPTMLTLDRLSSLEHPLAPIDSATGWIIDIADAKSERSTVKDKSAISLEPEF